MSNSPSAKVVSISRRSSAAKPRNERVSAEQFLKQAAPRGSRLEPWLPQIQILLEAKRPLRDIRDFLAANGVDIGITGISNYLSRKRALETARAPIADTLNTRLSDAEICRKNGWAPGTVLAGNAGQSETVIRVTAVGEANILAKELRRAGKPSNDVAGRETIWHLSERSWHRID